MVSRYLAFYHGESGWEDLNMRHIPSTARFSIADTIDMEEIQPKKAEKTQFPP
jgi:hypothetical protein